MTQVKEKTDSPLIGILKQVSENVKLTGIVKCESPDGKITSNVFIKEGQVVYATSTMHRSKFGDMMVKKGIITQKELSAALGLQKEHKNQTFIGEILIGMGLISERVIPNLLYHQIEVVIYEILTWKNPKINFEETNIDKHPEYKRPGTNVENKVLYSDLNKLIDPRAFIKALENNQEPLLKIRHNFVDPDSVPKRVLKSYPSQLTFDQRKILRAIDGANSLNDIVILSDLDYFNTYKILFDLAEEKVISIPNGKFDEEVPPVVEEEVPPVVEEENQAAEEEKPEVSTETMMMKFQQQYLASREEIKQLKYKINDYENSKLVLNEDITLRASRLPYHKKVMLNSILKNILDMVESI